MIKIWILEENGMTFWKEHGKSSWSRDIGSLMRTIKEGYEIRYCNNQNNSAKEWEEHGIL